LSVNVPNLAQARDFYGDVLGCAPGRSAPTWLDVDFFGHQLSPHLGEPLTTRPTGQWADTACRCRISA